MNEKVINLNGDPNARETVTDIPPGFQPMPAMVILPIIGHTAPIQPITAKENIEGKVVGLCRGM